MADKGAGGIVKRKLTNSYKGQEIIESLDHSDPEGIWHIEDVKVQSIKGSSH